jgi:hypothetical protein
MLRGDYAETTRQETLLVEQNKDDLELLDQGASLPDLSPTRCLMNRQRERLSNRCDHSTRVRTVTRPWGPFLDNQTYAKFAAALTCKIWPTSSTLNSTNSSARLNRRPTHPHHPTVSRDRHWLRRPSHRVPRLLLMRVPCLSQAWGPGRFLALPRRRCRVLRRPPRLYCRRRCLDRRRERMKLGASQAGLDVLGLLDSAHR